MNAIKGCAAFGSRLLIQGHAHDNRYGSAIWRPRVPLEERLWQRYAGSFRPSYCAPCRASSSVLAMEDASDLPYLKGQLCPYAIASFEGLMISVDFTAAGHASSASGAHLGLNQRRRTARLFEGGIVRMQATRNRQSRSLGKSGNPHAVIVILASGRPIAYCLLLLSPTACVFATSSFERWNEGARRARGARSSSQAGCR